MSLPPGYVLVYRDDALSRRRLTAGRRVPGRVRVKKDGGRPWVGPWRRLEREAVQDAEHHARRTS